MVSYFTSACPHRRMGSSVQASCSWHLTSSKSLMCMSEISQCGETPRALSNEWPLWDPPCFEAKGPPSISTTNGCSAWLLTPKLSILFFQGHGLTSTCLSTSVCWADENSAPDQQPTKASQGIASIQLRLARWFCLKVRRSLPSDLPSLCATSPWTISNKGAIQFSGVCRGPGKAFES